MPLPYVTPKQLEKEIVTVKTELEKEIEQGGGGTNVEANPSGAGTQDLTKLKVANTIYNIPSGGGTTVEANPQDEATVQLTKLKVDNTTYSVPQGGGNAFVPVPLGLILGVENQDGSVAFPESSVTIYVDSITFVKSKLAAHLNDIIPDEFLTIHYNKNSNDYIELIGATNELYLGQIALTEYDDSNSGDKIKSSSYLTLYFTANSSSEPAPLNNIGKWGSFSIKSAFSAGSIVDIVDIDTMTDWSDLNIPNSIEGTFILPSTFKQALIANILDEIDLTNVLNWQHFLGTYDDLLNTIEPVSSLILDYQNIDTSFSKCIFSYPLNVRNLNFIDFVWGEGAS